MAWGQEEREMNWLSMVGSPRKKGRVIVTTKNVLRKAAKSQREKTVLNVRGYKRLTTRSIPSLIRFTLKLTSKPSFKPVNFKYVMSCFL